MTDITTAEALDALPVGSVVLDGMGDAWQRSDADTDWWAPANPFYDEADAANVLELGGTEHPVTLLHRPDRPSDLAAEVGRRTEWRVLVDPEAERGGGSRSPYTYCEGSEDRARLLLARPEYVALERREVTDWQETDRDDPTEGTRG